MGRLIVLFTLMAQFAQAETSVVPPGVRAFVYHRIQAEVEGSYNGQGQFNTYDINERLGADVIGQIDPKATKLIDGIKSADPKLAESLDLGTLELKPDIRVNVDVYGGAFGVSRNFMLVGVIPVYNADVNIAGGFKETQSLNQVANQLNQYADNNPQSAQTEIRALSQILRQLAAPKGSNLQSILVDDYGYKPLGNWQGQGIGDIITYGQYRFADTKIYKGAAKLGAEIPTGRTDDPDNLVDVPFGKGHFVTFVEALNDFYVWKNDVILAVNGRYGRNWGHTPILRLVPDTGLPLARDKEQVYRKPGDSLLLNLHGEARVVSELFFSTDFTASRKFRDKVRGSKSGYNYGILENKSEQTSYVGEVGFFFSTAPLYTRGQFPIPFKIGTFMSRVLGGENVDSVDVATLRFEAYF